jgi:hypothetical protein
VAPLTAAFVPQPFPPVGKFTLETHLNYVGIGTKTPEVTVAPTNYQFRMILN